MAGASNFMTDTMNVMGMQGLMNPNPYLQYTGQIPMAGYRGVPTDAAGNPIQSFLDAQKAHDAWRPPAATPVQGTTLNSAPRSGLGPGGQYGDWTQLAPASPGGPGMQAQYAYNLGLGGVGGSGSLNPSSPAGQNWLSGATGPGGTSSAAAAPAPQNPIDMRQAYLDALSSPGKVTTPGAQMLPGTTPTGPQSQPSVLNQFLAQHPGGGTTGGGGYNNTGFFNTLNALKQGGST